MDFFYSKKKKAERIKRKQKDILPSSDREQRKRTKGAKPIKKHKQIRHRVKGSETAARIGDGIEVKQSFIANANLGLFLTKDINKDECITQYVGQIISSDEARQLRRLDARLVTHMATLSSREVIDGREEKVMQGIPGGCFANHSESPNAYLCVQTGPAMNSQIVRYKNNYKLIASCTLWLVANQNLTKGTEVTINYGKGFCWT